MPQALFVRNAAHTNSAKALQLLQQGSDVPHKARLASSADAFYKALLTSGRQPFPQPFWKGRLTFKLDKDTFQKAGFRLIQACTNFRRRALNAGLPSLPDAARATATSKSLRVAYAAATVQWLPGGAHGKQNFSLHWSL
jgi:hypothetical protein